MFPEKEKSISLDKQKEIFYNLVAERTGAIKKLHNSVKFQNLVYHFKVHTKNKDFSNSTDAETLFGDIKSKRISFEDVEKNQRELESNISSVKIGGNKSDKQLSQKTNYYKNKTI